MFKRSICGQSWKPISRKGGENIFLERGERDVNSDLRHSAFFYIYFSKSRARDTIGGKL